jgi:hypothetical protein
MQLIMMHRFKVIFAVIGAVANLLKRPALCLSFLLTAFSPAWATVVPRLSFEKLTGGAERIVHARCVAKDSYLEASSGTIWTRNVFEIIESYKGGLEPQIAVSEPGGIIGNRGQWVPGAPQFVPGEEVVLFLSRTLTGKWRVYGWGQGNFRVQQDPVTGMTYVQPDLSGIELAVLSAVSESAPQILPRETPARETMDQLKQRIREQLAKQAPLP